MLPNCFIKLGSICKIIFYLLNSYVLLLICPNFYNVKNAYQIVMYFIFYIYLSKFQSYQAAHIFSELS
ncbi:MAG TPA: hypothetical protein DCQ26_06035 [Marinilabiliales bacterium]|nr:MAG: hypothetical protein A2W95_01970 [Bacteroidetes bacterium GWA2_40_14]OFX61933.1 MAG: hypothetical protein A2W84_13155 [Bacteroidetes bacterium GWC2_40_13]OFX74080.1 MAG: hypothetical protein A2W96_12265 [Bacteroidetes bacterium GWD2_40_43]OFX93086.1 MAG: hypothetical protein A2W97_05810 [Bacteroidetes bacterium GWE2_40_63]OFY21456.1 MAG: hypothetical protein A2W88_09810 [Bacteroidetes bacterium GWF2_40_13]OFZ25120.1 MAG: hypothetical protein A2437_05355 [Bacteroidetes bacterium RIFOXYC